MIRNDYNYIKLFCSWAYINQQKYLQGLAASFFVRTKLYKYRTMWSPQTIAKLVTHNSNFTMVYGCFWYANNYSIPGFFSKSTNITSFRGPAGGPTNCILYSVSGHLASVWGTSIWKGLAPSRPRNWSHKSYLKDMYGICTYMCF